jgi:ketosteroid isomerase-like protein
LTATLPPAISAYLRASDERDLDAITSCFAEDAIVVDEDKEWRGRSGIREWREGVATAYEYTVEVLDLQAPGAPDGIERWHVFLHLEGNFPDGKVNLTSKFELVGGLIAKLEIVPT